MHYKHIGTLHVDYTPTAFKPAATMAPSSPKYAIPSLAPRMPAGPDGSPLPVCTLVYSDQPTRPNTTCTLRRRVTWTSQHLQLDTVASSCALSSMRSCTEHAHYTFNAIAEHWAQLDRPCCSMPTDVDHYSWPWLALRCVARRVYTMQKCTFAACTARGHLWLRPAERPIACTS